MDDQASFDAETRTTQATQAPQAPSERMAIAARAKPLAHQSLHGSVNPSARSRSSTSRLNPTAPASQAGDETGGQSPEELQLEMAALKGLLGFQLRQASFHFSHLYAEHLHTLGLSPLEFSILEVVNMNAGVTAQQICKALNLRAPNAVKLIQALSEQELIERKPHPHDRRAFGIELTAKGSQLTTQALEHSSQLEKMGLKGLSERRKTALLKQLELINKTSQPNSTKSKSQSHRE